MMNYKAIEAKALVNEYNAKKHAEKMTRIENWLNEFGKSIEQRATRGKNTSDVKGLDEFIYDTEAREIIENALIEAGYTIVHFKGFSTVQVSWAE